MIFLPKQLPSTIVMHTTSYLTGYGIIRWPLSPSSYPTVVQFLLIRSISNKNVIALVKKIERVVTQNGFTQVYLKTTDPRDLSLLESLGYTKTSIVSPDGFVLKKQLAFLEGKEKPPLPFQE